MAVRVLSSAITKFMARGVAPLAADENADTIIDNENVLTESILDATMLNRPSKVLRSISGKIPVCSISPKKRAINAKITAKIAQ